MDAPANGIFSSLITHLVSMLYGLMKILSRASAKKGGKKGLRVSDFALLLVIFKSHHGIEGVNMSFISCLGQGHLPRVRLKT